ncbi:MULTISPECIES: ATP-binding protein [unclassified Tolypothrix]|uniref:ATP-binding protein n=1 Tax=unclassified Tolypothrix TaxID=2649714 RepID=UPI0005EAC715|nr:MULTISPECIES: ATP-binding protein [unclassified Tolypothrix]BAY89107.1 two-component hybrid sensor and regulator [Microchaete diplosiphon NIES-3275]EKF06047.1 sensor histidine kinase [Tolypothrix sp. PCC 7601]MBE9087817.1 response regulator [Tolypothrix sp. LEGE 11397]UYD29728.1 response regulator [Tolypothrix sp. PCC 7712]UYD34355.1 response regulator [Tolypothrix sp. PCC 7601]
MLQVNRLRLQVLTPDALNSLIVQVSSAIAILVGVFVLVGWSFDIEFLKCGCHGNIVTMKANTALGLILSGVSLWLAQKLNLNQGVQHRTFYHWCFRLCTVAVTLIGFLTVLEYVFGGNLGIDEFLFRDSPHAVLTLHPGRMGFNTALDFMLIGRALELLVHQKTHRSYWYAQILALIAGLISLQAVIGYAYQVNILYGTRYTTSMAIHTALTFLVLCLGIMWTHPNQGLMRVITSNTDSGLLSRRLLLAAIAVPFLLGWLIVQGQKAGGYDTAFAISLFAIIIMVIFVILIWQSAIVVERLSRQRDRVQGELKFYEEKLKSFFDANVIGILFGDIYGGIQQANDEFLAMVGYTRADLLAGRISWSQITPPEYLHLDEQSIAEAKANANGACTPYEKAYIRKDGSLIPVFVGFVLTGENREEAVAFIINLSERQQAREQIVELNKNLQRRVTELQTLLDVIPIGIGIAEDSECRNIKANPAFAKKLGISPDNNASLIAPIGEKPGFKIYREGKEVPIEELPMQYCTIHGVEVLDYEFDIVQEDGTSLTLVEYVAPLFDEDGNTRGCIGAFLDITERKQNAQVLRNQQRWLEDVLNLMPRPLLFIEPGTAKVTFANRAADELAGGEFPKGIPVSEYDQYYHFTDANGDRIPNEQMPGVRVARGERLHGLEVDWHTSQGVRSLLVYADTMPAMHGYPATCLLVFQDITNIKDVEKALSINNQRLKLLFHTANELLSSQNPVALVDSLFRKIAEQINLDLYLNYLIEDNSGVMRLASSTGISPELTKEIEYLAIGAAVCGTTAQTRCQTALENVQASTDPKTELIRALGIKAYFSYPLMAQGQPLGTLSFGSRTRTRFTENQKGMMQAVCDQIAIAMERARLISSLQQQTEQLQEANRMKDEFLAILSHELRSPLNAILGWAQLLRSRNLNPTQTAKALETIERNAKAQTQLIEDLLDISRMIRGKLRLTVATCNLITIIKSGLETLSLAAQAKDINLHFTIQENSSKTYSLSELSAVPKLDAEFLVSGDAERLQQIIWNLLSNAIKFTAPGGQVDIKLGKIEEKFQGNFTSYAQIQVIDTGIGISAEFLPYVFDRFRQADSSSTRMHGGLGLGLAIVRHLVELHGGTVQVDSPGEQQGATFTVKLPLLSTAKGDICLPPSSEADSSLLLNASLAGIRVLIVDDEEDSREFIATVLQQVQAEVQTAASAPEAMQLISQWQPDVIVSDIGMPKEDGYSFIRKVRSLPPEQGGNIPAAALTAYARAEDRRRAIQEGYQLHLPKPIEPAELATVVASLVGRG